MTPSEVVAVVKAIVQRKFQDYLVEVYGSADGDMHVYVYSVSVERVRLVRRFIMEVQERPLVASSGALLTPMVKTIETTREHYPDKDVAVESRRFNVYLMSLESDALRQRAIADAVQGVCEHCGRICDYCCCNGDG